jgi:FkbM family methyltransferase
LHLGKLLLRTIARRLRHAPLLEGQNWLWNLARAPYQRVLGARGQGVKTAVGSAVEVRMPAEFCAGDWEVYEPESVRALANWAKTNPGGLILDVVCSVGIFSVVSLFADISARVIAFDPDLNSVAATLRICRYASGHRLSVIYGFLTNETARPAALSEALTATQVAIADKKPTGDLGTNRYVCLTGDEAVIAAVPRYTLDTLFAGAALRPPVLLKCDVEGAELLVLRGAETMLAQARPHLLLSVHPPALPEYGHSVAQVEGFLHEMNYRWDVIAVDHEEHWLARPN